MGDVYLQCFAAALFSLVFLFLWRQSGFIYFAYWSLAWIVESLAGAWPFREPLHALLEGGFALLLVAAARAGLAEGDRRGRSASRVFYLLPVLVLVFELVGQGDRPTFFALRSLVFGAIYFYCFQQLTKGSQRLFRFTLIALAVFYFLSAAAYLLAPTWLNHLNHIGDVDLALKAVLAFSAMAMWIENQNDRVAQTTRELDRMGREAGKEGTVDYLTGLLNQDTLQRRLDDDQNFRGVVAVCDLDDFKSINDRFGHLVGDEVLRSVGNLLRSSIRAEDLAYRWGGDELAVLFRGQETSMAQSRMAGIEARLEHFRVRGYTSLQIRFSWGVAEGNGVPLREVLERADQEMYAKKRAKMARPV